jgi:hypothetical protein
MDEKLLSELPAWLTEAGFAGATETDIVAGFLRSLRRSWDFA